MYILPSPQEFKYLEGEFILSPATRLKLEANSSFNVYDTVKLLKQEIKSSLGFNVEIIKVLKETEKGNILFKQVDLENEAYELIITPHNIKINYGDEAGLLYGIQSLRQQIRISGKKLQAVEIKDKPDFKVRGFYHDITRGKVPTLKTLKELADRAAFYKINQLQLYVEHSFAFKNFSEIWADSDPLTAEEIIELDEYCKSLHIELVPSLSTFGHMYEFMRSISYSHLCELDSPEKEPYSWVDRMRHHTLDVSNKESIKFVEDILEEFIPLFSSDKFNICGDETFDLGEGKNKDLAEKLGKGKLYVDFLNKIITVVKKHNKKVMFWGDIIIKHPEFINEIPKDVICLNWDYSEEPSEENVKTIKDSSREQYLCPGVDGWCSFMNRMENSYSNISKTVAFAKKYKATGILNTDWGDFGHLNLLGNSMPGMIYGAALSWNSQSEGFMSINKKISTIEYRDSEEILVDLLSELSKQQAVTIYEVTWWLEKNKLGAIKELTEKELHEKYKKTIEIEDKLINYLAVEDEKLKLDMEEFYVSARAIALFNSLGLIIKKYELNEEVELIDTPWKLAVKLELWLMDYKRVWLSRNKESELYKIKDMIIRLGKTIRSYK
jgi:hypothetical protein